MTLDGPLSVTLICAGLGAVIGAFQFWQEIRWKRQAQAWRAKHPIHPAE
jgi:hypothetical protein